MELEIRGIQELFNKLDQLEAIDILERPMQRAMLRIENRIKEYPVPPARSTYVRTGTLGRRWVTKVNKLRDGVEGRIGNNTEYAPWVQSRRFQAAIHQGRWQTAEDVLTEELQTIINDFERAIKDAIR